MNNENICFGCFRDKGQSGICPYCGFNEAEEQPYLALPMGTILNGRYMTGKVLGMGGFGITYLGYDMVLEIIVAIKEYMPSAMATRHSDHYSVVLSTKSQTDYKNGMNRFLEEARILAKLQNTPNIVSVQNYFQENNTGYFVMEYVDGMSLKTYLAKNGNIISYDVALAILIPIMKALIKVHSMNLLHRDISPDNIYITASGGSRLLDFGAARFAMGDGKSVSIILKHGYAPEEQYSSHGNQGPWTDVYAMGATLYRCITGKLPPDSIERIHNDRLIMPSAMGIQLPKNVEDAIMISLAVKAENRFPNMESFMNALNMTSYTDNRVPPQAYATANSGGFSTNRASGTYGGGDYYPYGGNNTGYSGSTGGNSGGYYNTNNTNGTYGENNYPYTGGNTDYQYYDNGVKASKGFWGRLKAKPAIAALIGGGLVAVIALCIIIPIALSGGSDTMATEGNYGGGPEGEVNTIAPKEDPDYTAPTIISDPTANIITRELTFINATIDVPADYISANSGSDFINEEKDAAIINSYYYRIGVPIYSIQDVDENKNEIVERYLAEEMDFKDYKTKSSSFAEVNGMDAYKVEIDARKDDGTNMKIVLMFIEGKNGFGCYVVGSFYPAGNTAVESEVLEAVNSFKSKGKVETELKLFTSEYLDFKFVYDSSLISGEMDAYEVETADGESYNCLYIDPDINSTEATIRLENTEVYANSVYEIMEYWHNVMSTDPDVVAGDPYASETSIATWQCRDYTIGTDLYVFCAAEIDGRYFLAIVITDEAHKDVCIEILGYILGYTAVA